MKPAEAIEILERLVKPPSDDASLSLEEALTKKLDESCRIDVASKMYSPDLTFASERQCLSDFAWWKFTQSLAHCLLDLELSLRASSGEDKLLSVNQKKTITEALELFVTFGALTHLGDGIGLGIEHRSTTSRRFVLPQNLNPLQKFLSIEYVCHCLLLMMDEETLWSVVCSRHLGDLLASLFAVLLFNEASPSPLKEEFAAAKRNYYKTKLSEILEKTYQPTVIRELMLLLGNKKCPSRMSRALRGLLTERLMADGGVLAVLRSITEISGGRETPRSDMNAELIARLIITPHIKDVDSYYRQICPTVISLLTSEDKQFSQICVLCVRRLYETKRDVCQQHFLDSLLGALEKPTCEESLCLALERIYVCFAIPGSDLWSVPVPVLLPYAKYLFRLHSKIVGSVCATKSYVEDLVWKCFSSSDFDWFKKVFHEILFGNCDISFRFGEGGGVFSTANCTEEDSFNAEDASDCVLDLFSKRDSDGKIKTLLFQCLIDILIETDGSDVKTKLVATKMLSVLSSDTDIFKHLNSNPTPIIEFLKNILERKLSAYDSSIMGLGLMVLGAILSDTQSAARRDWKLFACLVEPLKKLKSEESFQSQELKLLADEIYCMILTHGIAGSVLKPSASDKNDPKIQEAVEGEFLKSECSTLLEEACHPLLPVRAQALRKLAKLVLAKDPHAVAKKEAIFCIFKENLKDGDSYMYLSAIEGLASIASVYPGEVVLGLTEQYVYTKESQLRLKVGQVLIQVVTNLGELIYNYKAELLNAFLYGCRDPDPLVRASSLSNLGQLCRVLAFRIGVFVVEIFDCVESIIETDKAPEARRAALMLITLLLKGLGTSALSVLESVLVELYRRLRKSYQNEKDEVCRLQAQLALEELNSLTKQYLMPEPTFTKRIFVLDPPP